jgi:hypothetical protein
MVHITTPPTAAELLLRFEIFRKEQNSKWWSSVQLNAVRATNIDMIVLLIAFQNKGNGNKLNYNETFSV